MKGYESCYRFHLTKRTPVILRIDGRAFHTFTRTFRKPFDYHLIETMVESAKRVAREMQGCVAFYHQSDEVSFLLNDYKTFETSAWFGNNKSKLESVSASLMTGYFNELIDTSQLAFFDARAFNIPKEEVTNCFLWRIKDWERNSVSMLAMEHFSDKELHGKGKADRLEMLEEIGVRWDILNPRLRHGSLYVHQGSDKYFPVDFEPTYESVNEHLKQWLD